MEKDSSLKKRQLQYHTVAEVTETCDYTNPLKEPLPKSWAHLHRCKSLSYSFIHFRVKLCCLHGFPSGNDSIWDPHKNLDKWSCCVVLKPLVYELTLSFYVQIKWLESQWQEIAGYWVCSQGFGDSWGREDTFCLLLIIKSGFKFLLAQKSPSTHLTLLSGPLVDIASSKRIPYQ